MGTARAADDFKRLRIAADRRLATEAWPPVAGAPAFVGQVTSDTSTIAVGRFVLVGPTYILGPEAEGGAGTLNVGMGSSVPVYLIGPAVPSKGDFLVCRFVDHRWVAERMSAGGISGPPPITIASCFCPIPATLSMTSGNPSCNYGMFQSCTIAYQATPGWASGLGLGPMIFLSNERFLDSNSQSYFYYYMWCQYNQFSLTRLYPTSPYGSPYRDALLYSWLLGGHGNSCNPFRLDGGKPYPGSDQSCLVMIDPA